MRGFSELVLDGVPDSPVEGPFVFHNPDGDCVEVLLRNESYYAERVDDSLTVYYSQDRRDVVGGLVTGVKRFLGTCAVLLVVLAPLAGCAASAPAASSDAIARYEAALADGLGRVEQAQSAAAAEASGKLESVLSRSYEILDAIDNLANTVENQSLPAVPVPQAAKPSALGGMNSPVDIPASGGLYLDGQPLDVQDVIARHYRVTWTYPGTIDAHLREHGVTGNLAALDRTTKERLHSALHERERGVVRQRTVVKQSVQACPGGVCPAPSRVYAAPQVQRWRLFGRRR